MQSVLWFAGLRGAIAFALSENMPGPNKDFYATATLFICIFTTVVCGGLTDQILTMMHMKSATPRDSEEMEPLPMPIGERRMSRRIYYGVKGVWKDFDNKYLKDLFGGSHQVRTGGVDNRNVDGHGHYEMTTTAESLDADEEFIEEEDLDDEEQ
jgi:sodium/hydrogen exchanger 8